MVALFTTEVGQGVKSTSCVFSHVAKPQQCYEPNCYQPQESLPPGIVSKSKFPPKENWINFPKESPLRQSTATQASLISPKQWISTDVCWDNPFFPPCCQRLKGTPSKDRSQTLAISIRNSHTGKTPTTREKKTQIHSIFSLSFWFCLWKIDVWISKWRKHVHECCHFVPKSLWLRRHEYSQHVWWRCQTCYELIIFCSSLAEQTKMAVPWGNWLQSEKVLPV